MAIEGSSSTTVRANVGSSFYVTAYFKENSTSTSNNTSNIYVKAGFYPTASGNKFWVTGAGVLRVYWHDNHENYDRLIAENWFDECGYDTWERVAEGTFNATHNDDGKLSGYVIATWTQNSTYGGYVPVSGSTNCGWTDLTEIARKATVTSVQNFNDEGNPVLGYSNKAGNAVAELKAGIYKTDGTTALVGYRDISKTGTSYTFNLTNAERETLRNAIPNSNTLTVRFYVRTKIGSNTFLDYKEATFSITNGNPTFSNYTFKDSNSTTTAITGNNQLLIQGKSSLQVNISTSQKATANKGASMSSYSMSCAGLTASVPYATSAISQTLGSPSSSGTQNISVTAIDSRGNSATVNKSVTVIPYYVPQIFASGKRLNNFEANTTITFENTTNIAPITVSNTRKNGVNNFKFRYKKFGANSWQEERTVSYTVANDGKITATAITVTLDNNYQWVCQIELTDKLSTSLLDFTIDVGIPIFRIGLDGNCYNNEHRILTTADLPINSIADGIVSPSKIDPNTLGQMVFLQRLTSIPTSEGSSYKIDIRSMFTKPGSTDRQAWFDAVLMRCRLYFTSNSQVGYLRFGNSISISNGCHRCMLTINDDGSGTASVVGDYPNIILCAQNFLAEEVLITNPTWEVGGSTNVDSGDWNNFSFTQHIAGNVFSAPRINLGSFIRTQYFNGKIPMWLDGNTLNKGYIEFYGIKYPKS